MSQRTSIAENLSESIRCLQFSVEQAWQDGIITDAEQFYLRQEFLKTKKQARVMVAMQTLGIRIIRTGKADRNLMTELRALQEDGQGESRLIDFTAAYDKKHSAGLDGGDAA